MHRRICTKGDLQTESFWKMQPFIAQSEGVEARWALQGGQEAGARAGTTLGTQPELQAGNTDGIMCVYAEFPECFKKTHGILGLRQAPKSAKK